MRKKWVYETAFLLVLVAVGLANHTVRTCEFRRTTLYPLLTSLYSTVDLFPFVGTCSPETVIYYGMVQEGIQDETIFNPRTDGTLFPWLEEATGIQRQFTDEMTLQAIENWRATKMPGYLKQAEIPYLFIEDRWMGFLTPQEYDILNNPVYYELVLNREFWENDDRRRSYRIYRVVGNDL